MKIITTYKGQTVLDIAVRYCGDAQYAYDIAVLNGIDVTQVFIQGVQVAVPEVTNNIASYFENNKIQFETGSEFLMHYWDDNSIWQDIQIWQD
ncbi:MAG: hypothetical protein H6Q15_1772 [Bacteroidetes bacterium]|nr:hypothetical protein [Bacteroidota bacterium]